MFSFIGSRPELIAIRSITSDEESIKKASQKVEKAFRDLQKEGERAHTSRLMDPSLIRSLGTDLEAQLAASRPKKGKGKGKGKLRPSTSVTMAVSTGEDLSYLPLPSTMLGATPLDMLPIIDTGVPLSLREFLVPSNRETSIN